MATRVSWREIALPRFVVAKKFQSDCKKASGIFFFFWAFVISMSTNEIIVNSASRIQGSSDLPRDRERESSRCEKHKIAETKRARKSGAEQRG